MQLAHLLGALKGAEVTGSVDREVTAVVTHSRDVQPGSLFVAIQGFRSDGHAFLRESVMRGATTVVTRHGTPWRVPERVTVVRVPDTRVAIADLAATFYGHPSREIGLIGVTGTNGKTTTTYLIRGILEAAGQQTGLIGTIAYWVGGERIPATHTTPEAPAVQELLRRMVTAGLRWAIMEVSSHALKLERVRGCEFDVAVFTNLTQDHLDFHQTFEDYARSKLRLFTGLDATGEKQPRAVINVEDPWGHTVKAATKAATLSYSLADQADITASAVEATMAGVRCMVRTPAGSFPLESPLPGRHNVANLLAATGVGIALGLPITAIQAGAASVRSVPGRFERVDEGQDFAVLVDYAHTEDALRRLLAAVRELTARRLITVFGCGGDRDQDKRPRMGRAAAELSDVLLLTSDNPRSEDSAKILREIEAGVRTGLRPGVTYEVVADRREAIERAIAKGRPRDTVVIAGKGHEEYQLVGDRQFPFDDRVVAREAIRRKLR